MIQPAMRHYLNIIRQRSLRMFITVARVMVPVMAIVYLADRVGLVSWSGHVLAPVMGLLDLPPEAGIIWATTIFANMYAGIASLASLSDSLQMTEAQVSALGAMMLFAHNVPTEQAIVRRAGASALLTGGLRIGTGALYGAAIAWTCQTMGWLQDPVSFTWMRHDSALTQGPPDFWPWTLSMVQSMGLVLVIIVILVVLLDVLERMGVTRVITRLLVPVLRISGLEERAAPLTTVGVLLGLAFGGALIIEAAEREHFSKRTRLLALSWLSLYHALIEDTLLVLSLGANLWIILVLRGAVTLGVLALLAAATRPGTWWGKRLER